MVEHVNWGVSYPNDTEDLSRNTFIRVGMFKGWRGERISEIRQSPAPLTHYDFLRHQRFNPPPPFDRRKDKMRTVYLRSTRALVDLLVGTLGFSHLHTSSACVISNFSCANLNSLVRRPCKGHCERIHRVSYLARQIHSNSSLIDQRSIPLSPEIVTKTSKQRKSSSAVEPNPSYGGSSALVTPSLKKPYDANNQRKPFFKVCPFVNMIMSEPSNSHLAQHLS